MLSLLLGARDLTGGVTIFSPEMEQALADDGYEGAFHYGIVGHDPDSSNLDAGLPNSCCQCYQLVFDDPTYLYNPEITPPKPLIVQSANTQASGPTGFDVFMGAGGFGVFNACSDTVQAGSMFGNYIYTGYPAHGQAFSGGVKPGPDSLACDENGVLTGDFIATDACQQKIEDACNEITSANATVQSTSRHSCIQSNQAEHYYHENWNLLVKRVACPTHLTEVTGCKPGGQDSLPMPDPDIQTAEQANSAGFYADLNGARYHTTTMQDCCMPTCAWSDNVSIETLDGYNSFYSCDINGAPITE